MQADRSWLRRPQPDWETQRAVLALVLATFPVLCTIPELGREIGSKHAVVRAVGTLEDFGLVERRDEVVMPTPAALLCHSLDAW
ncbi:MAG: hypothetical protein QOE56_2615 [Solirubrobacterales bacterium]|jgi:hypothetical protein|nr:hypothetical protein [Solirubrobacterales bacterium]